MTVYFNCRLAMLRKVYGMVVRVMNFDGVAELLFGIYLINIHRFLFCIGLREVVWKQQRRATWVAP